MEMNSVRDAEPLTGMNDTPHSPQAQLREAMQTPQEHNELTAEKKW